MIERIRRMFQEETLAERSQRMIPAAGYAFLVATVYAFTLALINVISFPNLPLGIDWLQVVKTWIGVGLAFALFGAIAAWFTEEYEGIVGGGVIITLLLLIFFRLISRGPAGSQTALSIVTALPLFGVSMLGAWAVRWVAHRHLAIVRSQGAPSRGALLRHIAILIGIGLLFGIVGRMDPPAQQALQQMHELLQAAPNDPSVLPRLPLKQVPALQDHLGVDYKLYPRPSTASVGTLDVTVRFTDGFAMTCNLPLGAGTTFITDCNEGTKRNTAP